ncbi:MAG TPA: hypothetical protein VNN73_19020 [Blastocatellia bacterium]|nr:hypothetical protein [Blastocatellia bacterium]
MKRISGRALEQARAQRNEQTECVGLITKTDYSRSELYGFEVDMNGDVITPEFRSDPDCATRLKACIDFAASVRAAREDAA